MYETVLETDRALAFPPTNPSYPVRIVVVPKEHVPSLPDLGNADPNLLYEIVGLVREVAAVGEKEYESCSGTTDLGLYPDSKHMHWHVVLRGESAEQTLDTYSHHDD
ncbi:HIT family protein [Streptomyces nymphaeiformis]|uniref:Histidine triad (HIT) family protein n=1 Tax=Streptomyces nymphaeiformis TaxID=2663842 RepID=A0A7W7XF24_9ACTN|nr:HIT domain-containing protein [Streptomyces nymphaeiformis]MBB4986479.1 histidine triad (HIT) family protein [Streptomyces nymphaeiformis]